MVFAVLAAFEMPLFAFVSGYLTRMTPEAGAGHTALDRVRRLIVPFVVWAPITWALSHFAWSGLEIRGIPASLVGYFAVLFPQPRTGLWYLLVLFYWWLIVIFAKACFRRVNLLTLALASGAALVAGVVASRVGIFAPSIDFGFRQLVDLLPFFFSGWAVRTYGPSLDARLPRAASLVGVALLGVMVASVLVEPSLFPLGESSPDAVASLASRLHDYVQAALGVGAALLLLRSRVSDGILAPFALAGRSSMGIYAIHLMFLRTGFGEGWVMAISSFAIAMAVSLVGTWLLRKTRPTAEVFLGELRSRVAAEPAVAGG